MNLSSNWTGNDSHDSEEGLPRSDLLRTLWENGKWEIPLYSVIFLLAVVGNTLVILTLGKNNRMRTITNVFLLNLAASDLVLAVLCMPFTLIGTLLRNFIFGEWMCRLVPFLQATSVAASVWTLVALSIERYYAICHPLRSRKWQTLSHARRLIGVIWIGGAILMLPIVILSELQPTIKGHNKCRENWPSGDYERVYNLILDLLLLVVPLVALGATYYLIATTLWKDMVRHREENALSIGRADERYECFTYASFGSRRKVTAEETIPRPKKLGLRHSNYERNLVCKQRVIKMLFVVVLEFFICWTPLYVINTLALFWPKMVYGTVGYKTISFCQLLAYSSGCCNPITYCFMNSGFKTSFINVFTCRSK